jgi:hypothetical protein
MKPVGPVVPQNQHRMDRSAELLPGLLRVLLLGRLSLVLERLLVLVSAQ